MKNKHLILCVRVLDETGDKDYDESYAYDNADPNEELRVEVTQIRINYPMGNECMVPFTGPVTRRKLVEAVKAAYARIYAEEDAAVGPAPRVSGACANRAPTKGPWGIWGHDIDDLYIEGFTFRAGVAQPMMGS